MCLLVGWALFADKSVPPNFQFASRTLLRSRQSFSHAVGLCTKQSFVVARPKVRIRCHCAFIQECHELAVSFDEQSCCVPALDWRTTLPPLSLRRMGTNKFARYCTPKLIFLHAESVMGRGKLQVIDVNKHRDCTAPHVFAFHKS